MSVTLTKGEDRKCFKQEIERYKAEKADIKAGAEKLEAAAREADKKSEMEMHVHGRWALSTTLLQVSIALSAIALLTRRKWLLYGVFAAAGIGITFGVMGMLHM